MIIAYPAEKDKSNILSDGLSSPEKYGIIEKTREEVDAVSKQKRADLLLVLVTAFWGASYYLSDLCLNDLPPLNLTAFRFGSAFILLGIPFWKSLAHINRQTLWYSFLVGLALAGTYVFYGYGLPLTSISNASFVCALPVVFTPVFDFIIHRNRPGRNFGIALIVCTLGLALLTLGDSLRPAVGDLICLGVPICYSIDLLLTEKAVNDPAVDPLALGVAQLGVVAVITLAFSLLLEKPHLPTTPASWGAALFLGILCTGVAFVIQATQQKYTTATHVGLIFTLEPVFSCIVAFIFANERLSARGYIGAELMLFSLIMMEVDFSALFKRKKA